MKWLADAISWAALVISLGGQMFFQLSGNGAEHMSNHENKFTRAF